jgi:hypothetical protein
VGLVEARKVKCAIGVRPDNRSGRKSLNKKTRTMYTRQMWNAQGGILQCGVQRPNLRRFIPRRGTGAAGLKESVMNKLLARRQKGRASRPCYPGKLDVRGLISRRLEKKGRFSRHFSPLTTLISRYLQEKCPKIFIGESCSWIR